MRRVESIKQGSEITGNRIRARIVKNKIAAPFRLAEFDIMFNHGISRMGDLLELGTAQGIIKKSGAFYSYGETKLGQGRENSKEFLTQHPEIADSVEVRIRDAIAKPGQAPADETNEEATGSEYAIPNVTEPEAEE